MTSLRSFLPSLSFSADPNYNSLMEHRQFLKESMQFFQEAGQFSEKLVLLQKKSGLNDRIFNSYYCQI